MARYTSTGSLIGPHSRHRMKAASPFATLLLDIGYSLTQEDIAGLKLTLQVDRHARKLQLEKLKSGCDILSHMEDRGLISRTDTKFLENLFISIGRKDLLKKMNRYHEKLNSTDDKKLQGHSTGNGNISHTEPENTVPKQVFEVHSDEVHNSPGLGKRHHTPMKAIENRAAHEVVANQNLRFTALKSTACPQLMGTTNDVSNTRRKNVNFTAETYPVLPYNQHYRSHQRTKSVVGNAQRKNATSTGETYPVLPYDKKYTCMSQLSPKDDVSNTYCKNATSTAETYPVLPYDQQYMSPQSNQASAAVFMGIGRSCPDGQSVSGVFHCQQSQTFHRAPSQDAPGNDIDPCNLSDTSNGSNSSQGDVEMQLSQRCQCSQDSQMSISDDDKLSNIQEKGLLFDGDSSSSNML